MLFIIIYSVNERIAARSCREGTDEKWEEVDGGFSILNMLR